MIKDDNNENPPTSVKVTENKDESNSPDEHYIDKNN